MFGSRKTTPQPPARLIKRLSRRGPHKVLRGDLAIVGQRGVVFTPESGRDLPAIAFGHAWLAGSSRYRDLLLHLASWGIVVAVPDAERGPLASDIGLAASLRSALSLVSTVRLGFGELRVDPARLGLAGHGFGASAAVLAASEGVLHSQPAPDLKALAALFPAPTTGAVLPAATTVTAPTMVLGVAGSLDTMTDNPLELADAIRLPRSGGPAPDVVLRTLAGVTNRGLLERPSLKSLLGQAGVDPTAHRESRALLTGFLLHRLNDDPAYQAFSDPQTDFDDVISVDFSDPPVEDLDHISRLLGAKPRTPAKN